MYVIQDLLFVLILRCIFIAAVTYHLEPVMIEVPRNVRPPYMLRENGVLPN